MKLYETNNKRYGQRRWFTFLLWAIFGAGLLVQLYAPGLQIKNHAFDMPSSLVSRAGHTIDPAGLVARERLMQSLSAMLTLSGALGLAIRYRRAITRSPSL